MLPGGKSLPGLHLKGRDDKITRIRLRRTLISILFLSPALVLTAVFFIYPLFRVFIMSFQHWRVLKGAEFIGLENYAKLLRDGEFWKTLWNTVIYTLIVTPMIFVPAIALANCLRTTSRKTRILRTIFFIPVAVSFVSASYIWKWIYNDTAGLLNYVLNLTGIMSGQQSWLSETWLARVMVSIMIAWKTQGMTMIILIAGLQSIPQSLYEASEIDGASRGQRFRFITLPMLRPVLVLALIISVAGSFKAFDHFFIMTRGGPMKTTETVVMYINKLAFEYFDVGLGSAVSVVLLVILFIVSSLQIKLGGYKNE